MNSYSKLLIYYFSGTGNAKSVSEWIAQIADEKQLPAQLINIATADRKHIPRPETGALIGFCSPTHGFNFPPVMMHFIFRFPRGAGNRVFIVNTRAGMKLGKIFLPGLSGIAHLMSALVLLLKGYRIAGMKPVDLPSNWISLHPGLRQRVIDSLFKRWKGIVTRFAEKILSGGRDLSALLSLPVDLLIAPVSVLYYVFGRFVFAKSFYASHACNNCGLCIRKCPIKAISLVDNRPFWSYRCESCMHCMNNCPENAIQTAHGFVIGILIVLNALMQSFVYIWFLKHHISWFSDASPYGSWLRFILDSLVGLTGLIISYRLVHYLRKWKPFEMLVNYTSLTVYKFWGRYKPGRKAAY